MPAVACGAKMLRSPSWPPPANSSAAAVMSMTRRSLLSRCRSWVRMADSSGSRAGRRLAQWERERDRVVEVLESLELVGRRVVEAQQDRVSGVQLEADLRVH